MKAESLKARKYWAKRKRRHLQAVRRLFVRNAGDHDRRWSLRVASCYPEGHSSRRRRDVQDRKGYRRDHGT